jgi:catechol 2,3-dioxygenase-like lactoylglutathione lyase family enzyme
MSAIRVVGVGHIGITVSDIDRSISFYRDVLGFEVGEKLRVGGEIFEKVTGVQGAEIDIAFVRAHGQFLELLSYVKPEGRTPSRLRACDPGFMHVAFKVKDLENVVASIEAHGFEPMNSIQTVAEGPAKGLRVIYARDPDGVVLEFIEEPRGTVLEHLHWP